MEIAVYTQNRVIEKYSNDREKNKPKQKIIKKISPPQKPDKSYFDNLKFTPEEQVKIRNIYQNEKEGKLCTINMWTFCISGLISNFLFIIGILTDNEAVVFPIPLFCFIFVFSMIYFIILESKIIKDYKNVLYENAQKEYDDKYSQYLIKKAENDKLIEYNNNALQQNLKTYNTETAETLENHKNNLNELKK